MPPTRTDTDFRNKLLIANSGILVALLIQFWRDRPLAAVLLTGLVMVVLVNAVLMLADKPRPKL